MSNYGSSLALDRKIVLQAFKFTAYMYKVGMPIGGAQAFELIGFAV